MKIECPNCGCINHFNLKQDNIKLIIKKFKKKSGALLCTLIDENGSILASETDDSITKSTEKKIIALHLAFSDVRKKYSEIYGMKNRLETISFFEEMDLNLKGFLMIKKEIVEDVSLITIIPSWLDLSTILQGFKQVVKELIRCLHGNDDPNYVECTLIL